MKKFEQVDQILKQTLSSTVEPSKELNQKILSQLKEIDNMKYKSKRRVIGSLIAAVIILAMSATAFAAWQLLNPKQVAEHFGNQTLAKAFESEGAVEINKSISSYGYNITLLGVTTGKNLSDFKSSAQNILLDRTYAVVSIAKEDGSKMPSTSDEAYGDPPFFVSPLIKGQKPWQVNIASMNGAYIECVIDGVMYRLLECDGIEMFADRGLFLCVSTTSFFDINAFKYDEKTGEVTPKSDFEGVNVLFDLPLDVKKADHEKAEKYLKELLEPSADSPEKEKNNSTNGPVDDTNNLPDKNTDAKLENELKNGVIIPESVKEVTYDKNGMAYYEYKGSKISFKVESIFDEDRLAHQKKHL